MLCKYDKPTLVDYIFNKTSSVAIISTPSGSFVVNTFFTQFKLDNKEKMILKILPVHFFIM